MSIAASRPREFDHGISAGIFAGAQLTISRYGRAKLTRSDPARSGEWNPDVDAVYRLTQELLLDFFSGRPVLLAQAGGAHLIRRIRSFGRTFPSAGLPSKCSFRMIDIWRSWVAQHCLWEWRKALCFIQQLSIRSGTNTICCATSPTKFLVYLLNDCNR